MSYDRTQFRGSVILTIISLMLLGLTVTAAAAVWEDGGPVSTLIPILAGMGMAIAGIVFGSLKAVSSWYRPVAYHASDTRYNHRIDR